MNFINRKGETVDFNLSTSTEPSEPIFAKSGGGQNFVSTSMSDLKNLPEEEGRTILSNANNKITLK